MRLGGRVVLLLGPVLLAAIVLAGLVGWGWGLLPVAVGASALLTLIASTLGRDLSRQTWSLVSRVRDVSRDDSPHSSPSPSYAPELEELDGAVRDLAIEIRNRLSELETERDELQGLMESIAEGVMALTPDARVLRMNSAAAELLDLSSPVLFAPVGALIRHPELRDYLEDSVVSARPPREVQVGERHLLVSSLLLPEAGSVVTFLDVTGLRRLEQVRRDFVANASHELKTPLTAIRGFAETLLDEEPPEHLRVEFLKSIRNNALRVQTLVDNLLDLSRLESGGWMAEEEDVGVAEAAAEAWEQVRGSGHGRGVTFSVEGDAVALADRQALHQIFSNLFDNALRYTPADGNVTVRVESEDGEVRISVRDTGTGISSSALPRIFERFYRADTGRDRKEGGTGLGLAIVRHLVQSMKGEVGAESRLGEGTTIFFTLPRVGSPPDAVA